MAPGARRRPRNGLGAGVSGRSNERSRRVPIAIRPGAHQDVSGGAPGLSTSNGVSVRVLRARVGGIRSQRSQRTAHQYCFAPVLPVLQHENKPRPSSIFRGGTGLVYGPVGTPGWAMGRPETRGRWLRGCVWTSPRSTGDFHPHRRSGGPAHRPRHRWSRNLQRSPTPSRLHGSWR